MTFRQSEKRNTWIIAFCLALLLGACVHEETHTDDIKITAQNLKISAPEFLKFTPKDLDAIRRATAKGAKASKINLSEKRTADCADQKCRFENGELAQKDLVHWETLLAQARKSGKEEKVVADGPVTLRCSPSRDLRGGSSL